MWDENFGGRPAALRGGTTCGKRSVLWTPPAQALITAQGRFIRFIPSLVTSRCPPPVYCVLLIMRAADQPPYGASTKNKQH